MAKYSKVGGTNVELLQALIDDAPSYTKNVEARNSKILKSIINNTEYTDPPQSEIEELLLELKAKIGGEITVEEYTATKNGDYDAGLNKAYNPFHVALPLDSKTITANGTYTAAADDLEGFDEVTVNVSGYQIKNVENLPASIASFTDGANLPMPSLKTTIVPIQSGSGDPSPSNVRPISGWSGANIVVSPTTDAEDGHTYTIPFTDSQGNPIEVFGGELDVVNGGENPNTLGSVDMGTLNWTLENGIFRLNENIGAKLTSDTSAVANMMCSHYKTVSQNAMGSTSTDQCVAGLNWSNGVRVKDSNYTDVASFKQAMSGVQLVYELATPTTFTSQPTSIKSLEGTNNVWGDCGQVNECGYFAEL